MKGAFSALVTTILLAAAGCHKEDNNATIQGKWFLRSTRIRQYMNSELLEDTTYLYTKTSYEFTNDGTYIYQDEDGDTLHFTYTYDSDAHTLVTISGGDSSRYQVLSLTPDLLQLYEELSNESHKIIYDENLRR